MRSVFMIISALILSATATLHSIAGERMLITPLLKHREGILRSELARFLIRLGWHITSLSWLTLAIVLFAFALAPDQAERYTLLATGVTFTLIGIFDLLASRGRHIGWVFLTAIGVFALIALFVP